ncbi:MAG: hypothetical protein CFE43_03230 [Burkholderiales bacterium PBB3]|nr:MAG: hypothetical protein CFE43_03230 [Burkholderiales bacterium PBB3]
MRLQKTEKAKAELQPGVRTLGQRQRTLLLMADGRKTMDDFSSLFNGEGAKVAFQLIGDGYLIGEALAAKVIERSAATARMAIPVKVPTAPAITQPIPLAVTTQAPAVLAPQSSDQFEGRRSLATARMFLFDLVERMFTRRAPALAEQFREALRNARDRDSMLAAAREMIAEIEAIAGHERADSISERIAMLLPVQD